MRTVRTESLARLLAFLTIMVAISASAIAPAVAQRGDRSGGGWEPLGEARVAFRGDSDVIALPHNEDYYHARAYRRLRFVIEGGEVKIRLVRLVYLNGHTEELEIGQTWKPGQQFDVDLRGERSYLREIHLLHKGKFDIKIGQGGIKIAKPKVIVYGQNIRALPPPPLESRRPAGRDFETLAAERFDRRVERVVLRVGKREGRIARIMLAHEGEPIRIKSLRIRFGNDDIQNVQLDQRLRDGEQTRSIDLDGDRRFIEQVTVILDPRDRPGSVKLTLLGLERGGREDREPRAGRGPDGPPDRYEGRRGRPDWVLLGRQTVDLGVDSDAIEVGRDGEGGGRGFDKLHFIAETNELFMRAVRVVYANGYAEDYRIEKLIPIGGDLALDLPGRRSFIRRIETVYSAKPGFRGQSVVSVFGEAVERR